MLRRRFGLDSEASSTEVNMFLMSTSFLHFSFNVTYAFLYSTSYSVQSSSDIVEFYCQTQRRNEILLFVFFFETYMLLLSTYLLTYLMELTLNGGHKYYNFVINSRGSLHECHMNDKKKKSKFNCLVIDVVITSVCKGLIPKKNAKNHIFTP